MRHHTVLRSCLLFVGSVGILSGCVAAEVSALDEAHEQCTSLCGQCPSYTSAGTTTGGYTTYTNPSLCRSNCRSAVKQAHDEGCVSELRDHQSCLLKNTCETKTNCDTSARTLTTCLGRSSYAY